MPIKHPFFQIYKIIIRFGSLVLARAATVFIIFGMQSCSPPVYEKTTFGIEDFALDSQQISQGKLSILSMEEHESPVFPTSSPPEELIADGDELSISLYCPQRSDRMSALDIINSRIGFVITDGKLSLPHLEPIYASGITLLELKKEIQNAYSEQIPDIQVFLNFKKRKERYVQIIGGSNGLIGLNGQMKLSEVLAKAQFNPYSNLFKSYVIRDGRQLQIDLYKLIHEGDQCQNIVMQEGDQIFIANERDAPIMVTGEVFNPSVIPVPYGFMTLREALARAGGIPFTGAEKCMYVIRGDLTRPKIYKLAWCDLVHYPIQSLLLMPGDIVVVSEKPITEWNRFINQLQPSTGCMCTCTSLYGMFR